MGNVTPTETPFEVYDGEGRPWKGAMLWGEVRGREECVGLRLEAPSGAVVTPSALRRIPVGRLIVERRSSRRGALQRLAGQKVSAKVASRAARQLPRYDQAKRGGRAPLSDNHLRAVSVVYATAWYDGRPTSETVANHFHVSLSTARAWVHKARLRGFLSPTTVGRGGT